MRFFMTRSIYAELFSLFALVGLAAGCDGGTGPGDTTEPELVSATSDGQILTLIFSEEVSAGTVLDGAFSITPGEHDLEEAQLVGTRQVTLEIDGPLPNAPPTVYTVTATGIADLAGNVAPSLSTTFSFGREAPVVGAAYRLPDSRIMLINGDGTRFSIYDPAPRTFTPPQLVDDLPQTGIPFSIGASGTRNNESLTYYWGDDGDTYIGFDYAGGAVSPTAPIDFDATFPDCTLPGGIGAAFTLGALSSNADRLYLFSADGTQYRIWSYAASGAPCGGIATFPMDFGGGGSPISAVGAAVYDTPSPSLAGYYLLFDEAGTTYTYYLGNRVFSEPRSTADLGDGTLTFE